MSHSSSEYEGRSIWRLLDGALAELEQRGDVQFRASRAHVLSHLCERLYQFGFPGHVGAAAAVALALKDAGWELAEDEEGVPYELSWELSSVASTGTERDVADCLRMREAEMLGRPARPLEELLAVARAVVRAQEAEGWP